MNKFNPEGIRFKLPKVADPDYCLSQVQTAAGTQTTFTNYSLPWGPGRVAITQSHSGTLSYTLKYYTPEGDLYTDVLSVATATTVYSTRPVAKLYSIEYGAQAGVYVYVGYATKYYKYVGNEYAGEDDNVIAAKIFRANEEAEANLTTKDTDWGYDEATKCVWVLASSVAEVQATATIGTTNSVTFTATAGLGWLGNKVHVGLVDPGTTATLGYKNYGMHVECTLAYATGALTTTPTQLQSGWNADAESCELCTITAKTGSAALAAGVDYLSGGKDPATEAIFVVDWS